MNLKLALENTKHQRCNCCERVHKVNKWTQCELCGVSYCDACDADLYGDERLCPGCDIKSKEDFREMQITEQTAYAEWRRR